MLRGVLASRLTCVVADAGFGKSTLLGAFAGRVNCAWYAVSHADAPVPALAHGLVAALSARIPAFSPEIVAAASAESGAMREDAARTRALAGLICQRLESQLTDLVLVLDDLQTLPPGAPSEGLLEALCRQVPSTVHVVVVSQLQPPFSIDRLRARDQVLDIGGAELAFSAEEVGALLHNVGGPGAAEHATQLHGLTDGWPAAVVLGAEAVARSSRAERDRVFEQLGGRNDLLTMLAGEVIGKQTESVRELIRASAYLERFSPATCEALGCRDVDNSVRTLNRAGFLVEHGSDLASYALNALLARFVRASMPLEPEEQRVLLAGAGAWFEQNGDPALALRCARAASDRERALHLVAEHGPAFLASGDTESVLNTVADFGDATSDPRVARVVGDALASRESWDAALEAYEGAAAGTSSLEPALAWRMASIHLRRGEFERAAQTFREATIGAADPRDQSLLFAMQSQTSYQTGAADDCLRAAKRGLELAIESGDERALAAAHTAYAQAATLGGDPAGQRDHWRRALEHAERAGYIPWIVTIRHNQAGMLVTEDAYDEALAELEIVLDLAEATGLAFQAAVALTTRAAVHHMRGALEEAVADLRPAIAYLERIASPMAEYSLRALGIVQQDQGNLVAARSAFERAIEIAQAGGDVQALTLAYCGLAHVVSETDPEEATELISHGLAAGGETDDSYVQIAAAHVALALGRDDDARVFANDAASLAERDGDRAGVAEALEVLAATEPDAATARAFLEKALAVWRTIGAPLAEARTQLSIARSSLGTDARDLAERAERALRTMGARSHAAEAAALIRRLDLEDQPEATIRSLGGLGVERRGVRVPLSEWQSRKARDLLKMLVARRGRTASRELLMDALWPEEDPAKASNRLSVALSTIRTVLDPEKRHPADHYITGDQSSVALAMANLAVDVERFLEDASRGIALRRESPDQALPHLLAAENAYAGDFLEDDVYDEWAVALREEARAAYVEVARALADEASLAGDEDGAVRYSLRILERDPYDERAHLDLVASLERAGRHGEARRAYRGYCARMEEIEVESAPFPQQRSDLGPGRSA